MAWFGRNKKEDEYSTYGRTEPGYGRTGYSDHVHQPVILDSDGRKHSVVGYTATHNSQRYVAKSEQVVRYQNFPGFPAMRDQKYSPPRKEVYEVHGDGDKPHPVPRISVHDRPEKTSEFSPKARDEIVHRQSKNSPWNNGYRDNSPPLKDQYRASNHHDYGKHNKFNSKSNNKYHDDDDDDDEEEEEEEEDEEVICKDGVCFKNPRKGSKPNYFKDENEKHKGNGYNPPTYTVPISTQPKRDTYYKTPHINTAMNNNNSDQKEKGNSYSPRNFPSITTQPISRDHTNNYPELPSNINKPTATSPPQFNAPPKRYQGSQETIDSTEARRRYGSAMPGAGTGSGYDEEKYGRTIDSNQAAKIYNGVLLPN